MNGQINSETNKKIKIHGDSFLKRFIYLSMYSTHNKRNENKEENKKIHFKIH